MTSSVDGHDHAVTDEEFAEHRPEPAAVCGDVVMLAPLTCPNGECCRRCVAVLRAEYVPDQQECRSLLARLLRLPVPRHRTQSSAGAGCSPDTAPAEFHGGAA
ncbi:MAG: hypothetical protein JOZ47_15330 [Kutzneria sp.]|nr:hypothetical protein [Kutzneria sp.]